VGGYCAGKAGLEALLRTAADELGHLGIRINCIRPGLVTSPDNPKTLHPDAIAGLGSSGAAGCGAWARSMPIDSVRHHPMISSVVSVR
jgi:NAD(P)-dependent dehydrogenase (short-subunit alcohol dehydrogenase family)